jgi:hypothetical protein
MILLNQETVKSVIKCLSSALKEDKVEIKHTQIYQCLAKSQGFNTDAAMKKAYPILFDVSKHAESIFIESIEKFIPAKFYSLISYPCYLDNVLTELQTFPFIASENTIVKIIINIETGYISKPFIAVHEYKTYIRGYVYEFDLSAIVTEDNFIELKEYLAPTLESLKYEIQSDIYSNEEELTNEAEALFNELADQVSQFTSNIFRADCYDPGEFLGDSILLPSDQIDTECVYTIKYHDQDIITAETDDKILRQIIATTFEYTHDELCNYSLYNYLKTARDELAIMPCS